MKRIGLLINPIAGMGGSVGLKGTDNSVAEALRRGAQPHAPDRAKIALEILAKRSDLAFVTCSGAMGEDALKEAGITGYRVLYHYKGESSSADTKKAVRAFLENGVDLVLFCGGDGTGRDVLDVTGSDVPILGIPAGVKMYSAVFAVDPASAADLVLAFDHHHLRDAEVLDVDEEAYRAGHLKTRLYGIARIPVLAGKMQVAKQVYEEQDEGRAKAAIAQFIDEIMLPGTLYIIGAGTTTEAIARRLGIKKTLLGVDAIRDKKPVAADCDEKTLLVLAEKSPDTRIIISPIGAQGFILGRGNQQISARLVRSIGIKRVIVVATPHKLAQTPYLYVDSGDATLDREFGDLIQVISGYRIAQRKKIGH
ncbi:MAG: ATP-NAD kinase family protein [Methanoregula sp.]|jgi:predicted polyphosphate/ATP-dependent NAD kinase